MNFFEDEYNEELMRKKQEQEDYERWLKQKEQDAIDDALWRQRRVERLKNSDCRVFIDSIQKYPNYTVFGIDFDISRVYFTFCNNGDNVPFRGWQTIKVREIPAILDVINESGYWGAYGVENGFNREYIYEDAITDTIGVTQNYPKLFFASKICFFTLSSTDEEDELLPYVEKRCESRRNDIPRYQNTPNRHRFYDFSDNNKIFEDILSDIIDS